MRYALIGRTFAPRYFSDYSATLQAYFEIPESLIEYDGEVEILKEENGEWVDARKRKNGGQVWRERIAEMRKRREER